jgi:hypothetical protein
MKGASTMDMEYLKNTVIKVEGACWLGPGAGGMGERGSLTCLDQSQFGRGAQGGASTVFCVQNAQSRRPAGEHEQRRRRRVAPTCCRLTCARRSAAAPYIPSHVCP